MKTSPRSTIKNAASILEEVMALGLASIGEAMVNTVIGRARGLTPSQRFKAIKDLPTTGAQDYKNNILETLSEIALKAINEARKEIPAAKKIKLVEEIESIQLATTTIFEKLPKDLQKIVKAQIDLLTGTQIADLEKTIAYQYTDSVDTTEDMDVLKDDLRTAAMEYIDGASVRAGAGLVASKIVNESRSAFFFDKEVLEEVDAFEFVNGDPVTEICDDLNGTVFAKDDPNMFRYTPPLHWNCKSYIRPVLKGKLGNREIEKLKPSTKKIEDQIQFSEKSLTNPAKCPHH